MIPDSRFKHHLFNEYADNRNGVIITSTLQIMLHKHNTLTKSEDYYAGPQATAVIATCRKTGHGTTSTNILILLIDWSLKEMSESNAQCVLL